MGTPAQANQSYLQLGREATFGTGVAATRRLGIISDDPRPDVGVIRSRVLNNTVSRVNLYQAGYLWRYRSLLQLNYEGLLFILDGLQGTATFAANGGTTTGVGPYVHTFVEKQVLNSYTLEVIQGNIPAAQVLRLLGAKIASARIGCKAGTDDDAVCTADVEWLAIDATPGFAITTGLTAATELPVLFHEASTVDDGTADTWNSGLTTDVVLKEFELEVVNAVNARRFGMGRKQPLEFVRNGYQVTTMRGKKEYMKKTMLDAVLAFTAGSPKLVFGSVATKRLTFDVGTAHITQHNNPSRDPDIIEQEFTWEAARDATNLSSLKVLAENNESAIG